MMACLMGRWYALPLMLLLALASASPTARLNRIGGLRSHGARGLAEELPGFMKAANPRPMVDPATPEAAKTTHGKDPTEDMFLVFSDEFETPGRSFKHGSDPYWTAIDHYNPTTSDLEYYTSDLVTTKAVPSGGGTTGAMVITATHDGREGHEYSAGMVTSWNQFCFTGGIVEIKLRLPGSPARPGLWPAAWMMGNLARAGYVMSTDRVWPWSYKDCDLSLAQYQKFDPCGNHSHNISGDVADKYRGRGGPEFDILETNTCPTKGLAPGQEGVTDLMRCPNDTKADGAWREGPRLFSTMHFTPKNPPLCKGEPCVYDNGFNFGTDGNEDETDVTHKNTDGDELHDFIGASTYVEADLWDEFHTFRLEWTPTREAQGGTSYGLLRWSMDGKMLVDISAEAVRERTGTGPPPTYDKFTVHERLISQEPMYMLFNIAVSDYWHLQQPGHEIAFPAEFQIDYVRVYQNGQQIPGVTNPDPVSCSPTSHPTAEYIAANADIYDGSRLPPVMCNPNADPPQTCPSLAPDGSVRPGIPGPPCPKCGDPACECPRG